MSIYDRAQALNEERMRVWHRGKELLDRAERAGGLNAEDKQNVDKAMERIDAIDAERDRLLASDEAKREIETVNDELRRVASPTVSAARENDDEMRAFLEGRKSAVTVDLRPASYVSEQYRAGARGADLFERRGLYSDAGGGSLTIPSLVASNVYAVMVGQNVMRQTRMSLLTTPNGDPLSIPVGSQGAATQIASENTTIAGTDPSLASKVLGAFRFGQLVTVSNALFTDSAINVNDWVGQNIGRSIATKEEAWWVAGDGSSKPLGIVNGGGVGAAGTVASGGSLLLGPAGRELEKLIDVQYSLNSSYRTVGEWLVNDSTAATMRKIRDGAGGSVGAFVWEPSPTSGMVNGTPDMFLGRPIHTSTNVGAVGSSVKAAVYGDFSYFVARQVEGLRLERSTDFAFDKDQIAVRGIARVDSDLADTTAINVLHCAVT